MSEIEGHIDPRREDASEEGVSAAMDPEELAGLANYYGLPEGATREDINAAMIARFSTKSGEIGEIAREE